MTTLRDITLQCPICSTQFRSRAVAGIDWLGAFRQTSDFRKPIDGAEALAFRVHQCSGCGFAGCDDEFLVDEDREPWLPAHEAHPAEGSDRDATGSEKYEAAARIAARRGDAPRTIADLLLRAAWCCIDEGDPEAERWFRREAAKTFARALAGYDDVPRGERAVLTYLVGELWRRTGDERQARVWFNRVRDEVTDRANQCWIVALAVMQRDEPKEWLS